MHFNRKLIDNQTSRKILGIHTEKFDYWSHREEKTKQKKKTKKRKKNKKKKKPSSPLPSENPFESPMGILGNKWLWLKTQHGGNEVSIEPGSRGRCEQMGFIGLPLLSAKRWNFSKPRTIS